MPDFVHLHCHTQYSLLDGATDIGAMMDKAARDGQKGVALTDHGNMFGAFKFVSEAENRGLKPIIGCEFYLVEDRHKQSFSRAAGEQDNRYHQLLLAKNQKGYENLSKLCSLGFIEGLYGKFPRIDKELIEKYHEGLIATSCCIGAEIPQAILHGKLEDAEKKLRWWLDLFGEDYYIELQRHRGLDNIDGLGVSQEDVNQQLLQFARKYNVKAICTNDSHYLEEEDYLPHDILLCVNTNSLLEEAGRFKFPSSDFYFKTQQEMNKLFHDVPESVDNTIEIFDKIDKLTLARDILLPAFPLPRGFQDQDDYLRHLTYEGAKRRYGTITPEIKERLDFELSVIKNSGYPGYFLIVQDFTTTARQMGVSVGPGRGSAAGSAVAYCIGITNVDPIKYDLLFERFLNPERVSMPDIDIDFDDEGRQKVIDYVIGKYGQNQVAQIVTYGTMAAKMSLRDVGRVLNVPLSEVDKVSKTFPSHLKASLRAVLAPGDVDPKLKDVLNSEELDKAYQFRQLAEGQDTIGEMIRTAQKLEGSVRNTGIHACGVVITPDEITKYVPVKADKDTGMLVSQFDNSVAEAAGLLKMDFLGLKTLTIIKDAVRMVEENHGVKLDMDEVPLDDGKTYELFQRGDTVGIFQYESHGMQKYMKELKPTTFEDLIAMNALYRPGPLEYIPEFIDRKHGRKPVTYDLEAMSEYLHETYGICLTGDALVHDATTGKPVRIDTLQDKVGEFYVQGIDEQLQTQRAKVTHWVCNGRKSVYEVKLRSGANIKMTSNHEVLTEEGWREIGQLGAGDYIATPGKLDVAAEETCTREQLSVLASLASERLSVPDFVFGLREEDIAFFLSVLLDHCRYTGGDSFRFAAGSGRLVFDIQSLLLRLGIASTAVESSRKGGFEVEINDPAAFLSRITRGFIQEKVTQNTNFVDKSYRAEKTGLPNKNLSSNKPYQRFNLPPNPPGMKPGQARQRGKMPNDAPPTLSKTSPAGGGRRVEMTGVRWDEITAIEPAGEELVYDITVEGIHNFVANNIIVHNCVYQEQVMLLSQKLANFTKGQADRLRKGMGKKKKKEIDALYPLFIEGGTGNGHPKDVLDKVWKDWEAFASYAFNKSHSTCYAFVAFQTAYLKAHYPAEFMASVLTHNKNDISKVTFFLQECKRMGLMVLGPSVNESASDFSVNPAGHIRFGLSALKGVGEGPVEEILKEREANGPFGSLFDMVRRLSLRAINKKVLESLALGGGFDCFEGVTRSQYFAPSDKYDTLLEHALRYGNAYQAQKAQAVNSLFGATDEVMVPEPPVPECPPWPLIEKLNNEKEVTGIFISGHPLDDYRLEIENFTTCPLNEMDDNQNRPALNLAGMVTVARHLVSRNGNGWGIFELSDYNGSYEFKLFGEDYQKFKHLFEEGKALFIKGGWQRSWRGDGMEFKVKDVKLLEGVAENLADSITLKLPLETITPGLIDRIDELCKQHKGPHRLRMELLDKANRMRLAMAAKDRRVNATNGFIAELEKLGVEYQVS
ncbi:MAG: DNA polymerase III subunit alpha [Lewinellaceae bacterium]|nr:DNA polymerase III subunit alpha [Lewinellaceae bacterium]